MSAITEFLLARIAEDDARVSNWTEGVPSEHLSPVDGALAEYLAVDPHRVQAECEAKRLVIRFLADLDRGEFGDAMTWSLAYGALCRLATVYADHPDFDQAWA